MTARVLVADDEPAIVMAVRDELVFEGFEVHTAASGPEVLERARATRPNVLILDLMLPGRNGFEVCRELRAERRDLWIIMVTVRGLEADRVTGFEAGVDDYVIKPFSLRELVGRIKVGLRRGRNTDDTGLIKSGDLEINLAARRVSRGGIDMSLTKTEFDILALLARRAGEVITRDEFLDQVWGSEVYVTHRTIDTHVASLRRKIEPDSEHPIHVQGVRGVGYRFAKS
jgi:DNA-binding response OmpR family regulator